LNSRGGVLMKKIIVLLLILSSVSIILAKNYRALKIQSYHEIEHENIIRINEQILFSFGKWGSNWVDRSIFFKNIDKLEVQNASIESKEIPFGTGVDRAQVSDNTVKWTFQKAKKAKKTFGLEYLLKGAIYQDDDADIIQYTILPSKHSYEIDSVDVVIDYSKFKGDLIAHQIVAGKAFISLDEKLMRIKNKGIIKKDESIELLLRFNKGTIINENPKWYQLRLRSRKLLLLYSIGGIVFILFSSIYALLIYKKNNMSFKPNKKDLNRLENSTDELTPIEAAYLLNISFPDAQYLHYIGSLLISLISKKYLNIVINKLKKGYGFDLQVSAETNPDEYETIFLDSLNNKKNHNLKQSLNFASLKLFAILKIVRKKLVEKETISSQLVKNRFKYTMIGIIVTVLGVLSILPLVLFFDYLTVSSLILTFSIIVGGIILIIGAQSISPLTAKGVYLSQNVYYHKRHIEDLLAKEYNSDIHQYMLSQLPYIFAYKNQFDWYEKIKLHDYSVPKWFEVSEDNIAENPFFCFKKMIVIILLYTCSSVTMKGKLKPISDLTESEG